MIKNKIRYWFSDLIFRISFWFMETPKEIKRRKIYEKKISNAFNEYIENNTIEKDKYGHIKCSDEQVCNAIMSVIDKIQNGEIVY